MKALWYVGLMATLLFMGGCAKQVRSNMGSLDLNSKSASSLQAKVSKAFSIAENMQEHHTPWYENRDEALALNIIATAYLDPDASETYEYQTFIDLVQQLQQNITLYDEYLGHKLSDKFSSISLINFEKNLEAQKRFEVAYDHRFSEKSILTDAIRPTQEKASAEMLIRINYKELKRGNLVIEGYKTIKSSSKQRNSAYYTLKKADYKRLNKQQKKSVMRELLLTALQLSIPEYIPINYNKFLNNKIQPVIVQTPGSQNYSVKILQYQTAKSKYKSIDETQLIYSTPLSEQDIKVLQKHMKLHITDIDELKKEEINAIADTLNQSFIEPLMAVFFSTALGDKVNFKYKTLHQIPIISFSDSYALDSLVLTTKNGNRHSGLKVRQEKNNLSEEIIEDGFLTLLLNTHYIKQRKLYNPLVVFDGDEVIDIGDRRQINILQSTMDGNEVLRYAGNGKFQNIYGKGMCGRSFWFLNKMNTPLCQSSLPTMKRVYYKGSLITFNVIVFGVTGGMISGFWDYEVTQENIDAFVKESNFKNIELYKSLLI